MPEPIVKMVDIEKHFGSVIALAGVSFDVHAGECHCLLGDNGAGKSTFIKTMSGVHEPSAGQIFFEGNPMQFADPQEPEHRGIQKHECVQNTVKSEVHAPRVFQPRPCFEIVDPCQAVLLHDAVLVVPRSHQQKQSDGCELQTHDREADDRDRPDDQSVLETLPDIRHTVGPHPARVVMRNGDPQID